MTQAEASLPPPNYYPADICLLQIELLILLSQGRTLRSRFPLSYQLLLGKQWLDDSNYNSLNWLMKTVMLTIIFYCFS